MDSFNRVHSQTLTATASRLTARRGKQVICGRESGASVCVVRWVLTCDEDQEDSLCHRLVVDVWSSSRVCRRRQHSCSI
eukprot:768640-Hanusia_phi.AAC.5